MWEIFYQAEQSRHSGGFMLRSILVSVLLALPLTAQAGNLLLSDLKAQNGVQLSADELKQLMPNAKVVSHYARVPAAGRTNPMENSWLPATFAVMFTDQQCRHPLKAHGMWVTMEPIALRMNGPDDLKVGADTYSKLARNITALSPSPTEL